jgi:hypothetical protein
VLEELTVTSTREPEPSRAHPRLKGLLILGLMAVILAVAGLLATFLGRSSPDHDASKRVNAYLSDLRNQRYSEAYQRLCFEYAAHESHYDYVTRQLREHSSGRGVASFSVSAGRTVDSTSYNVASGTVTLADGEVRTVAFFLHPNASPPCIAIVDGLD